MKSLRIGDITLEKPIIQGGMGVGVSRGRLAGAVSACGGLGVISSAQIGYDEPEFATDQVLANEKAIRKHIALAKQISGDKPVGINISVDTAKHKGLIGKGVIAGQKVILVKPMTYMNNSGECIREVMDYYKCDIDDFIVIFDDISLDVGKLRLRAKGSAGGHNGIKSIIAHLGSDKFKRIKFGVGDKPKNWDLADWVLGKFPTEEYATLREANKKACEAVECILTDGIESGMNKYNG